MTNDLAPFAGTVGGGFFIGLITAYVIKKVIKLAAVIVGLFIAIVAIKLTVCKLLLRVFYQLW